MRCGVSVCDNKNEVFRVPVGSEPTLFHLASSLELDILANALSDTYAGLKLDENDRWVASAGIMDTVRRLYRLGRKWRLNKVDMAE